MAWVNSIVKQVIWQSMIIYWYGTQFCSDGTANSVYHTGGIRTYTTD